MMDIDRLRRETPGVAHRVHFNNAGAGLMPSAVLETVKDHLDLEALIGGYEAKTQENERIEAAYASVARLIGADKSEIAFVENATVAWQLAFYSLDMKEGDRILTAEAEYAANYIAYLQMQNRTGCVIDIIPSDGNGATDPHALEKMIDDKVKLISITWIPTNGGLMNPAADLGRIAKVNGIPYLLDACQGVGQMPVDVEELGCDFLSATARKFLRGPRGTGFLYVSAKQLEQIEPCMLDMFGAKWTAPDEYEMRPDARRFETWESSLALHLGLGAAADYALDVGLEAIRERAFSLAESLRNALSEISGVTVQDIGAQKCAIVTFSHETVEARKIAAALREKNINVSASGPSSTLLDARARGLPDLVRVSPHYYNEDNELDTFLQALQRIVGD
jgi:selenocysteine lyase/cysteine desulfurase